MMEVFEGCVCTVWGKSIGYEAAKLGPVKIIG
jgi:hypothetical protein